MLTSTIFVFCSLVGIAFASQDVIGEATHMGMTLLQQSRISGATIRQCSCRELDICVKQFKEQAGMCTDACWQHIGKLAAHPSQLRSCFNKQQPLLESFVACIGANARACVNNENGPQIPKQDIRRLIHIGEQGFETSKRTFMTNSALQPYMRIVNAGIDFGNCFKECYMKKHEQGFCFDRLGCQPLLQEGQTKKMLKKCAKTVNWKGGAGELCECSMHAGIPELQNFCPLLKAMTRKIHV